MGRTGGAELGIRGGRISCHTNTAFCSVHRWLWARWRRTASLIPKKKKMGFLPGRAPMSIYFVSARRKAEGDEEHPVGTSPTPCSSTGSTPEFAYQCSSPKTSLFLEGLGKNILSWATTAVSVQAELPGESAQRNSAFLPLLCSPQSHWSRGKEN